MMKFCCTQGEVQECWFNIRSGFFFPFFLFSGRIKCWESMFFAQISVRTLSRKITKVTDEEFFSQSFFLEHKHWSPLIYCFLLLKWMEFSSFVVKQPLDSTGSSRDLTFNFIHDNRRPKMPEVQLFYYSCWRSCPVFLALSSA